MVTLIHFLWRALLLTMLARYWYVGEPMRMALYVILIIFLAVFFLSQTYLFVQKNREAKGKKPIVVRSKLILTVLTVGIPVKDLKEARAAFVLTLFMFVFFSIIYYPVFVHG